MYEREVGDIPKVFCELPDATREVVRCAVPDVPAARFVELGDRRWASFRSLKGRPHMSIKLQAGE
jgi:hypothetical protein